MMREEAMKAGQRVNLGLFLRPTGHHVAAWRHPDAVADAGSNFAHFVGLAQTAERGLFDLMFCADIATLWAGDNDSVSRIGTMARMDPYSLMVGLAAVTRHIGLVCTASTTYDEPFNLARRFATLDIISNGRAGWNLVTSQHEAEAANFGRDEHMPKTRRYQRAREFAEVVQGLWDSFEEGAFLYDKAEGRLFEPSKLHKLNHKGEFFNVRGPLSVPTSPQRYPVIVQAGASDDGRDLAAAMAEIVFAAHNDIASARAFYASLQGRADALGRDPGSIRIMPGFVPFVGRTRAEAQEKFQALQDLIHPQVGVRMLSHYMGYDLSGHPIDGPLPDIPETKAELACRTALLTTVARRENLTIRQLYERVAGGRGHFQAIGSPSDIVDVMVEWVESSAADGFNVMPPLFPTALDDFVELVVPELQRRGLYRTRYEGTTLRDHLGLPAPRSRHARQRATRGN